MRELAVMRALVLRVLVIAGGASCGRIAFDANETNDACTMQTFFLDADGDGYGDPDVPVVACEQPANAVTNADDCDDAEKYRYPGATEVCDGIANDCATNGGETCDFQCTPVRRAPPDDQHTYLMCGTDRTWTGAAQACADEGFTLAVIDDAIENDWVLTKMAAVIGVVDTWLGGSDAATEDTWTYPDGTVFWQGGMAIGGRFTSWKGGEPNNGGAGGPEHCLLQLSDGEWNDADCTTTTRKFACERI